MSHDDIAFALFLVASVTMIVALILQVVFGEVTVRRLRKNPETKGKLGIEFVSGLDIVGVAQALSLPRSFAMRSSKRPFSLLPNAELLYAHTTKADRFLARSFYWMLVAAVVLMVSWIVVVTRT